MEMKVKDFDDFKAPRRHPWLLLLVLAAVVVIIVVRYRRKGRAESEPPPGPVVEETGSELAGGGEAQRDVPPPEVERPPPPAPSPVDEAAAVRLLSDASAKEREGDLLGARRMYLAAIEKIRDRRRREDLRAALGRVNTALVLSPRAMPEKAAYVVRKGDSVERIARKFGTTVEAVQKGNAIANPHLIKAGDRFRIFTGKFSIAVSKGRHELVVDMNERFFKRYRVGTGKFGKTPEGAFKITEKIREPVWWRPDGKEIPFGDEENILGTHWMTLTATGDTPAARGYGIHGTWDSDSIGKAESAGCIRMRNEEVEELFCLVPVGTPVIITE